MPTSEMFTASDGTSFTLVPEPLCYYCSMPLKDSYGSWGVCWRCNRRLRELTHEKPHEVHNLPYRFARAVAAGLYITDSPEKGSVGRLISELKASGEFSTVLAEAITHVIRTRGPDIYWDVIVPVPAGSGKSFFPAAMLAVELGRMTQKATAKVLELDSSYVSGQGLAEAQKFDNMKDKLRISRPNEISGRKVLLIDDIMTTCGAAHWCSDVLLKAGATDVNVAVAGRSVDLRDLEFIGYSEHP